MKSVAVKGLDIVPPSKSSAFACHTPPLMPQMHMLCAVIGKRGSGKGVAVTNLLEKLQVVDRLMIVSPSIKSNKSLTDRLKRMIVEPSDLYHDVDDVGILADIVKKIEKERDDLEEYWEKLKRYKRLMKVLDSQNPLFHLSDDDLLSAYENGRFEPPKHKWDGRVPCIAVWFDDILGSQLMSGKGARQLAKLCMYHRHLGQFSHIGGAVGCSMIFCAQSYKSAQGGLSKTLRNNLTLLLLFSTKSSKELAEVAEEASGEVDEATFYQVYHQAIQQPHDFLMIDLHPKPQHPSGFRRNFSEFLVPQ